MEKQAKKRHLPFLTALARAKHEYALDMKEDDFIETAYSVWRSIGNIAPKLTRYYTKVTSDFIVEIPKQCEFIESVTAIERQAVDTTFDSSGRKNRDLPYVQIRSNLPEINESITTSPGRSVNYELLDDKSIKITSPHMLDADIMVVYRSLDTDDDGLPFLNDKEVAAIAAEVTKRDTVRKGFQGIGKSQMQTTMLKFIIGEADRLMAAAKVDELINDDAIDKMLDIQTSWDRKVYGRRFDLLK